MKNLFRICLFFWTLEAGFRLLDTANFLGISIVGQSNKAGDGGIYVGSIMKGFVFCQITEFKLISYM